jgi:hypothetical protein
MGLYPRRSLPRDRVDSDGETEVANYEPGDLCYFLKGHSPAIQTLGSEPRHAMVALPIREVSAQKC